MRTRANPNSTYERNIRSHLLVLGIGIVLLGLLGWFKRDSLLVEKYYSMSFYPIFSYVSASVFGWVPFSVGDLFYGIFIVVGVVQTGKLLVRLVKRDWKGVSVRGLRFLIVCLGAYLYFYVNWGLHYYRIPLQQQLHLPVDRIDRSDYIAVLDRYVSEVNALRSQLDTQQLDVPRARIELEDIMKNNEADFPMLSRTQVHAKEPLSNTLASYLTVTGYLNPFTQEVHVNGKAPKIAYPFTLIHELSHQMGIGFEDECNFIAFLVLREQDSIWYRYAAYYETIQYLLRPLYYEDKSLYQKYVNQLSEEVKNDMKQERLFWTRYRGPIDDLTSMFYGKYLQHNNQPEGLARYSLMNRLVVAWEKTHTR